MNRRTFIANAGAVPLAAVGLPAPLVAAGDPPVCESAQTVDIHINALDPAAVRTMAERIGPMIVECIRRKHP